MNIILSTRYRLFFVIAHPTAKLSRPIKMEHLRLPIQLYDAYFTGSQAWFLTVFPTINKLTSIVSDAGFLLDRLQARVQMSWPGHWGLHRLYIILRLSYCSYLTALHIGQWIEAITAHATSPVHRPFIAYLYGYTHCNPYSESEQVIGVVECYNKIVKWMHWIVEKVNKNQ